MTDKTDLIEQILSKLTSLILRYDSDGVFLRRVSIETTAEELAQLCIESDEAREYWQEQLYDIQQRAVQLAVMLEKQHFIEQACDAVHTLFKDNGLQKDIYYTDIAQAIRDKFK